MVAVLMVGYLGPVQKLIPIYPRKESVVPFGQDRMLQQVQGMHLLIGDLNLRWVMLGI